MNKIQLNIKHWLYIFIFVFLVIPFSITQLVLNYTKEHYYFELESLEPWIKDTVLDNAYKWNDVNWQQDIDQKTKQLKVNIKLINKNNETTFSNIVYKSPGYQVGSQLNATNEPKSDFPGQEYRVYDGDELLGIAFIQDNRLAPKMKQSRLNYIINEWGGLWIWIILSGIMLLLCNRFVKKKALEPLFDFQQVVKAIARKEYHFNLPHTPIKEINNLSESFLTLQGRLKEALEKQEQMEQERKLFFSSIIHDLRTPLFSIRGYLEGLKKGIANTPEKRKKYIDISYEKANVLNELISDLHSFTQVNYLEKPLDLEELNFTAVMKELIQGFEPELVKKEQEITFTSCGDIIFKGDYYLLSRAVNNILSNAIQYTPVKGQIQVNLEISVENHICLSISDNGPGILDKDIPYIFSPLYRGEKSRNRKTGGLGLGLTIANSIVNKHSGKIEVFNNNDKGVTFRIILKL
ncbi:HAMP domain-containing sensor histidine kinase [Bacillus sp. FJAT-51639]|uniref:histidine kinase n=1 Tax=Bacillus bruguierae TaxID=3127667 RepID=A0ABU8FPC0_9BACI